MEKNDNLTFLGGLGAGLAVMYLVDPARGRRRRHLIRDQAVHAAHRVSDGIGTTSRDLKHRASGLVAEAGSLVKGDRASDAVIEARARSSMGRCCSHPRAVTVEVEDGRVFLTGQILEAELDDVLSAIEGTRGVESVAHDLEVFEAPGNVPSLQGGKSREGARFELLQKNWTPAARLLSALAGGALTVYGARRKDPVGAALTVAGAGLLARAATNLESKRLTGVGAKRRAVDVQRTINVAVPIERAFQFWSNYENFPAFMAHVREVQALGDGRSKWVIEGPAGVSVEWVAEETQRVPNEVIAWRTQEGSAIGHAGIVRFAPTGDGGTRIDLKMSYNPLAGALGHAVLSLLGSNPRQRMIDDLARMKTALETGIPARDAAAPLADMPPLEREVIPGRVSPPDGDEPRAEAGSVVP
ncbi:MAG: SRPBCC family protein [Gemmatimonadaceae bacterium]